MRRLYVLYDRDCALCRRCRVWLGQQAVFVPLIFVHLGSPEAECRFPHLRDLHPEEQLVVISDAGEVWQGAAAWVMVLWALKEYRQWSLRLATPGMLPLAKRACALISEQRYELSRWLSEARTEAEVKRRLEMLPAADAEACDPVTR